MRVKIKIPKRVREDFKQYCKKEGRVEKIFCQDVINSFFFYIKHTHSLILLQPKGSGNHSTFTIELEKKIAIKVQALVDFFKRDIESVLYSIFIMACFYKDVSNTFEHDYKDFFDKHGELIFK